MAAIVTLMLSLAELHQKKLSSIDKIEAFRLQQQSMLEQGQRWFILPGLLILLAGGVLFSGKLALGAIALGLSLVVFLIIGVLKIIPAYTRFNDQFKRRALYALLEDLYPSVYYAPDNYIPSSIVEKANLYPIGEVYTGKDYVEGETTQANVFKFSELSIKSNVANQANDLFKGLFLVVDICIQASSPVYILPATAVPNEELLESLIAQPLELLLSANQHAAYGTTHPKFVKDFVVYSQDTAAAKAILSAPLINALYQWYTQWESCAQLSFVGQQLFLALPMTQMFPTPNMNQKSTTNTELNRFYDQLLYGLSVVEFFGDPSSTELGKLDSNQVVQPRLSLSEEEKKKRFNPK